VQAAAHGKAEHVQRHLGRIARRIIQAQRVGLTRADTGAVFGDTGRAFGTVDSVIGQRSVRRQGKEILFHQLFGPGRLAAAGRVFPFGFRGQAHKAHVTAVPGVMGQGIGGILQQPLRVAAGKLHSLIPADVRHRPGRIRHRRFRAVAHDALPLQAAHFIFGHQIEEVVACRGLGTPLGGQIGPGEGCGEEGPVTAVVKGTVAVGGIITAGPGGHVPEQTFAGNGHQAEGHAQPAGHGQDDIALVRVRVAGIGRGDLTAPFGQGGVGGRCRQGRQQQEEEERKEQPRSHG
jgi:hypothetical protein